MDMPKHHYAIAGLPANVHNSNFPPADADINKHWGRPLPTLGAMLTHKQAILLRAKDPKVRHARVCITVAGLVLQGIAGSEHWPLDALV